MYIRFVTNSRHAHLRAERAGAFVAIRDVLERDDLPDYYRHELSKLLDWFNDNLPIPPSRLLDKNLIYWYRGTSVYVQRMWELVNLLKEQDCTVDVLTTDYAGRILYSDTWQIGASPRKDKFRGR